MRVVLNLRLYTLMLIWGYKMQIEVYKMLYQNEQLVIKLEAICDSFSSLLWDVRYYECGQFEIYIAATSYNLSVFKMGRIIGRSDDKNHYGIIEKVVLDTNIENGDYLTVTGRFLMSLLNRRIIYPTLFFNNLTSYSDIICQAVRRNCLEWDKRRIPGLEIGDVSGNCWNETTKLQISYNNLMEWIYTICKLVGGTANIRLQEINSSGIYIMKFELSEGLDRSIKQMDNPHMVFSDEYNNLISFSYSADNTFQTNMAYILGEGEGEERKRTIAYTGDEPELLERYELYVDAKDLKQETKNDAGETVQLSDYDYEHVLKERGLEKLTPSTETSESEISVNNKQYQYNQDYFVGDYVTVENRYFGMRQDCIQLVGMIESFDQNGKGLTPTFQIKIITK